jgi:hypothetical protein
VGTRATDLCRGRCQALHTCRRWAFASVTLTGNESGYRTVPCSTTTSDSAEYECFVDARPVPLTNTQLALFERLLRQEPLAHAALVAQARIDIPPLVRGRVWSALLGVDDGAEAAYAAYDKSVETEYDRQVRIVPHTGAPELGIVSCGC